MRFIRIGAAVGIAALVFFATAGPAFAAGPSIVINSPGDNVAYETYPTMAGSFHEGGSGGVVTSASVALSSNDGFSSENSTQTYQRGGSSSSIFSGDGADVSFSWVPKPRYNGKYTLTVSATGHANNGFGQPQRDETSIETATFSIEVAPAKVAGVAAGMDDKTSDVTVVWNANPEPDLVGYQVLRSYQNGSAAKVGSPVAPSTKPTFHDSLAGKPQGQYKYAVQAIRRARTCPSSTGDEACTRGIAGPQSNYSAAVTVRGAGATTTTSTTIKKSGGSSGGGSSSGGSSSGGSSSGGGSSTGGGTSTGGSKGGVSTGRTAPRNDGGFAPGGTVDLSQFSGLLGGGSRSSTRGANGAADDGTYDPLLKGYEQPVDNGGGDDNSLISIGGASVPAPSEDWVKFIGAGSLMTALLVHVLWFKQQVDALPLETISD